MPATNRYRLSQIATGLSHLRDPTPIPGDEVLAGSVLAARLGGAAGRRFLPSAAARRASIVTAGSRGSSRAADTIIGYGITGTIGGAAIGAVSCGNLRGVAGGAVIGGLAGLGIGGIATWSHIGTVAIGGAATTAVLTAPVVVMESVAIGSGALCGN